ncbi:MAG: nucleotidyl transferase AbiEii/AbiGii toxin family protein, partial [Coriobacteriia bacterium]|nr:nucleotidyl transferase AbiEii/AbiGii toxin family protein [Coriobacteriia bacterium]
MKGRRTGEVAASVRQRLRDLARQAERPFDEVLQYFAMERFLFRLGCTDYAQRLTLKGAALLRVWGLPSPRPTRDLDFLGRLEATPEAMLAVVREVLAVDADDGVVFDREHLAAQPITLDDDYQGVRVTVRGSLAGARFKLQIDVGIGDVAYPEPAWIDYPQMLDLGEPRVQVYRPETAVAEKLQAMVELDLRNSRMKDFHDVLMLSRTLAFRLDELAGAIRLTFECRSTDVPLLPVSLMEEFSTDALKRAQWAAFHEKLGEPAPSLPDAIEEIAAFVLPALTAAGADRGPRCGGVAKRGRVAAGTGMGGRGGRRVTAWKAATRPSVRPRRQGAGAARAARSRSWGCASGGTRRARGR